MPLTVTQSKVLASHLSALRYSISHDRTPKQEPDFSPNDVISSLVLELGPHISPLLSEAINHGKPLDAELTSKQYDAICDAIDKAEDELQNCIYAETPPGRSFREIIAALLEQLMPILIQIIIGFLLEPDPKPKKGFIPPKK